MTRSSGASGLPAPLVGLHLHQPAGTVSYPYPDLHPSSITSMAEKWNALNSDTSATDTSLHFSMSSNVGLSTPRGSGTSGFVQRNSANLRPRDDVKPYPTDIDSIRQRQRQPDKEILEHEQKREIEVKVFELRDKLEDEG